MSVSTSSSDIISSPWAQTTDEMIHYVQRLTAMAQEDPQLAALMPDPSVQAVLRQPDLPLDRIIATALEGHAERPALGDRTYEIVRDVATGRHLKSYLPRFTTITYTELHDRVRGVASAWRRHEQHRVAPGDFVCILGNTGTDFVTVELASAYAHAVSVPLQSNLAGTDLDGIIADTAPVAIAATVSDLALAAGYAARFGGIRSIIAIDFDPRDDDERAYFAAAQAVLEGTGARLIPLAELVALGDSSDWAFHPPGDEGPDRMTSLIHSSGSTGSPKGAIITERIAKESWAATGAVTPTVRLCFAPLNHFSGRKQAFGALAQGGTAFFTAKSDMSTLFEDIRLVRPTDLSLFPRVFELIYQHYQNEVVRRTRGEPDAEAVGRQVKEEMRAGFLGDRVCLIGVGSAPTSPIVKSFIRDCFNVVMLEGYGTTEAGGGAGITYNNRVLRSHITDYKLADVPELGYYRSDKPYPRGELRVRTDLAIPGYFKRPEATSALFDEDGYLKTGDIMEERGPDHLVYIDRCNDVLKLSQGEFVTLGSLGTVFESGSALLHQIHLYGNSERAYLLAVVVPDPEVVGNLLGEQPDEAKLKALIRAELQNVTRTSRLRSIEVPRDFIIEPEPFSLENGLLSSARKRMRPNLQRKYGPRLEELYQQLERKQHEGLRSLKDPASGLSVLEKVGTALEACLGIETVDLSRPCNFIDLGGDSLAALSFLLLIEEVFGVELPVNAILSPAGSPQRWAEEIEAALRQEGPATPTFARVHGKGTRTLHAGDLDVAAFIDAHTLEHAPTAAPAARSRGVLLTGATGFLGRFLCLEWLEKLAVGGGKLFCLVRGADATDARRRLEATFEGIDPALELRFHALASECLEVLVGDVAEAWMGLGKAEFDRLANEVDRIVHPAALVNHVLGYEHLFGPNVGGVAELIRLALTRQQKRIDFVSSIAIAVTSMLEQGSGVGEDTPLLPSIALGAGYADGYSTSKWAAEQLLHSAHRRFGLPVNIFRADMMLAHRAYAGQINVPDMFTRLLYSVVTTGLAPESFYELEPGGGRPREHYDGLPVDFNAAAIVAISAEPHCELRTYHVVNHHADDGISLDTVIDWIESAGYPVERIRPHGEWIMRFEAKLRALPEEKRQHSSLTVLGAFQHPHPSGREMVGNRRFAAAVRGLGVEPEVPHITEALIHKYLGDMQRLGLIPKPAAF